jgi:hypothetical protein
MTKKEQWFGRFDEPKSTKGTLKLPFHAVSPQTLRFCYRLSSSTTFMHRKPCGKETFARLAHAGLGKPISDVSCLTSPVWASLASAHVPQTKILEG